MGAIIKQVLKNDLECEVCILELKTSQNSEKQTRLSIDLSYSLFDKISLLRLRTLFEIIKFFNLTELHLSLTHISEIVPTPPREVPESFQEICDLVETTQADRLCFDNQNLDQLNPSQIVRLSKAFQECRAHTLSLKYCDLSKLKGPQQTLLFSGLSHSKINTFDLDKNGLTPEQIEKISQDQSYYRAHPLVFSYLGDPTQHVYEYLDIPLSEVKP